MHLMHIHVASNEGDDDHESLSDQRRLRTHRNLNCMGEPGVVQCDTASTFAVARLESMAFMPA